MEQLNTVLPEHREEAQSAAVTASCEKPESALLGQIRSKFWIFGGISLIFGLTLTLLFYKAGIGLNSFLFTVVTVVLLSVVMHKLSLPVKTGTKLYYTGVIFWDCLQS